MSGRAFVERIEKRLREMGFEYVVEPAIGGLTPDFLVRLPGGSVMLIEAKAWAPTEENQRRAIQQAGFYRSVAGLGSVFVVLKGLPRGKPKEGLVNEHELIGKLLERSYDIPRLPQIGRALELKSRLRKRIIFAAMPFEGKYDDTFFVAIASAAQSVDAVAKRLDQEDFTGDIIAEMKRLIRSSIAVVADLSESKSNVLYETGFAHGLEVPTVHICSTPLGDLPFDVRNWNTIRYRIGRTHELRPILTARLSRVLSA